MGYKVQKSVTIRVEVDYYFIPDCPGKEVGTRIRHRSREYNGTNQDGEFAKRICNASPGHKIACVLAGRRLLGNLVWSLSFQYDTTSHPNRVSRSSLTLNFSCPGRRTLSNGIPSCCFRQG